MTGRTITSWSLFSLILPFMMVNSYAEKLYLDARNGNDANPGTLQKPIQTFEHAAELVNNAQIEGPTTLIVAPGIYDLKKTILFQNDRVYTKTARFTIRAKFLPDDPQWKPELMPVVISTAVPEQLGETDETVECAGIKPELNHVTIRGLKFLGSPVPKIWYYPIFRERKDLDDLEVTQCLFAMESYAVTCNVGILANGQGLVVDHCIFFNCRNPVVYWRVEEGTSRGNAMRYCIVDGAYTSGCWICDTDEDFEFHHNIITRSRYAWMRDSGNQRTYSLNDCIFTGNRYNSGVCGANWKLDPSGPEIVYSEENIIRDGEISLELGSGIDAQVPRNFLHITPGTLGSDLGAGLFLKSLTK